MSIMEIARPTMVKVRLNLAFCITTEDLANGESTGDAFSETSRSDSLSAGNSFKASTLPELAFSLG